MSTLMEGFVEELDPHVARVRCNGCHELFYFGLGSTLADIEESLERHKVDCVKCRAFIAATQVRSVA